MLGVWYGDCELYDKALEIQNQALLYSFSAKDTAIAPIITLDIFMV